MSRNREVRTHWKSDKYEGTMVTDGPNKTLYLTPVSQEKLAKANNKAIREQRT